MFGETSMKRALSVLVVVLTALVASFLAYRWNADRDRNPDGVYSEYDQEFRAYLANATRLVGKETIKVERMSDRFTVPQKLTIKGSPYEIGLTIGHIGKQAKARLPLVDETNRDLNQKLAELYRKVYPQHLEVVRGVAEVYKQPAEQIDLVLFERDFTSDLWCNLLQHERFYRESDFAKQDPYAEKYGCSVASYYVSGHQIVGRNFDLPSDRPHYFTNLEMAGTYRVMGHTVYDLTGEMNDGINEKGFSLSVAGNVSFKRGKDGWTVDLLKYSSREPYPREPAVVFWQMTQIVMQTCATVDEAVALLRAVRVWSPANWRGLTLEGSHWLLADATGKSVVVEWTPGDHQLLVFDEPGPYELLTNLSFQEGEEFPAKTCPRYRKARPLLERGVSDTTDMLEVMKAMRVTGPSRSLWISVMDLNARSFEVRYFKEFERKYEFSFSEPASQSGK
jgi:predicted choloylglycine hydrolase